LPFDTEETSPETALHSNRTAPQEALQTKGGTLLPKLQFAVETDALPYN